RQNGSPSVLPKKVSWRDRKPIVVLALLTAGLAGFVWYVVGTNLHTQYTAFSLTNPHNQLSGYPYLLQPHEKDPMRLDIFNPASSKQQYIVVARTPSRVLWKRSVTVAPGQHWWHIINLPTIGVGSLVHLHFMLMTTKGETIRQLWITYHVAQ
ncbi:MAG: hypothetical protein M1318_03700, partial [Firmicutes bacterium]|nr:hypothetical protein [Bacillota bacterium]